MAVIREGSQASGRSSSRGTSMTSVIRSSQRVRMPREPSWPHPYRRPICDWLDNVVKFYDGVQWRTMDSRFASVPAQQELDRSGVQAKEIMAVMPRMAAHVEFEYVQLAKLVLKGNDANGSLDVDFSSCEVLGASQAVTATRPHGSSI
jgi:hypothetical protein